MTETRNFRRGVMALGAGALALGVLTGPAQAGAQADEPRGDNVTSSGATDPQTQAAAVAYWTPKRMATATPAELTPSQDAPLAVAAPDATSGPATFVPPDAGSSPPATATDTGPQSQAGPQPTADLVGRPYTADYPKRLNGKVFFVQGGQNFVCSGTVVNSRNKDMVSTAGHCVSDGFGHFNGPVSRTVFVPAYSSAATGCNSAATCAPLGVWPARSVTTTNEWHFNGNFKQDYGYILLATLNGQHIVNRLGGHGSAFNQSRVQTFSHYGYPAAAPFNGYDQQLCVSGRVSDDNPLPSRPGPVSLKINCNSTGGTSGGGWLILPLPNGLAYVNSHASYRYGSTPKHLFGPYYGNEALSLFNYTQAR